MTSLFLPLKVILTLIPLLLSPAPTFFDWYLFVLNHEDIGINPFLLPGLSFEVICSCSEMLHRTLHMPSPFCWGLRGVVNLQYGHRGWTFSLTFSPPISPTGVCVYVSVDGHTDRDERFRFGFISLYFFFFFKALVLVL